MESCPLPQRMPGLPLRECSGQCPWFVEVFEREGCAVKMIPIGINLLIKAIGRLTDATRPPRGR